MRPQPCWRMSATTARASRYGPTRLAFTDELNRWGGAVSNRSPRIWPGRPLHGVVDQDVDGSQLLASVLDGSLQRTGLAEVEWPADRMTAALSRHGGRLLCGFTVGVEPTAILAFSSANANAVALPRAELAPVTKTTLPARPSSIFALQVARCLRPG